MKEQNNTEITVALEKSKEYLESAQVVSIYLKDLPLTHEQNDHLIHLLMEHGNIGRKDAMLQGFRMGIELMKDNPQAEPNNEFNIMQYKLPCRVP